MCLKTVVYIGNSVNPDQMPHSVASDLGLFAQACLSEYLDNYDIWASAWQNLQ